ncbi:hypothetical protein H4R20_004033 [Coemansia guatemalensis]|uniref:RNA helicase n=1 Tax=Coemansia guatemalensis TaxID=2761395 RepID=A0A9W8HYE1_9FUNG|nr:hypothetical protein H4R20_004033 [Coemansia guatemalensis]
MSTKRRRVLTAEPDHGVSQPDSESGFIRSYYGDAGLDSATRKMLIYEQRRRLPAFKHRMQLLYAVENNPVTVIVGEPGSGKSTQLPQYLYESGWAADGKKIACTQPRRVAAAMLAQRVSEEMGVELGTTVGYSVRFSDASDPQMTRIKYLTDGTLIRECLADPLLSAYSVVMVDEAQDRSIATDTLLALLKKILHKRKADLRVIISSATLDAEGFRSFFEKDSSIIVSISGQPFPVDTQYLAAPCENYLACAAETVVNIHEKEAPGDILVFLPGKDAILTVLAELEEQQYGNHRLESLLLLPMYAGISASDQKVVFDLAQKGMRKVILSTNVAETSVTIDGVVYVVDCGLVKQRVFDVATGIDRLVTRTISRSSAKQRAGRAGRTQSGKVYRLYTHEAFNSSLFTQHDVPEISRLSLATMVLTLKALGVSNLVRFDYFQPPPPELLSQALEMLAGLGAIDMQSGLLTADLGLHLAELPLDPPLGVCLLNSVAKFACVREAVGAVAMLSLGDSPFVIPSGRRSEALEDRREFIAQEGDVLTLVNVLLGYQETPVRVRQQWCHLHFLNPRLLDQAARISRQLESYLVRMGHRDSLRISCGRDFALLQKCLVSGFFTNVARLDKLDGRYRLIRSGQIIDIHPSSVYFSMDAKPDYVAFASAMDTTKLYMQGITAIDPGWLTEIAPHYFSIK